MFLIQPTRFGRIAPGGNQPVGSVSFMTVVMGALALAPGASSVTTFAWPSAISGGYGTQSTPAFGSLFVGPVSANSVGLIAANSFVSGAGQMIAVEMMNASESTLTQTAGLIYRVVEFAI